MFSVFRSISTVLLCQSNVELHIHVMSSHPISSQAAPKWSMPGSGGGGGARQLQGEGDDEGEEEGGKSSVPREWVGFWRPNLTITLIDDFTT